jgi:ribosomal protein L30/L7E
MKALEMLNKVKELVGVELDTEVTLAQATLKNGTVIESENFSKGSEVFIVTEDEKVALPVGNYELEDGEMLSVKEEGIIDTIGKAEQETEQKEEELTEEVEEVEAAEHDDKEKEMKEHYATKTELEEVKKLVEEVKDMVKAMDHGKEKEEMSAVAEPPQKIKHSPEKVNKVTVQMPQRQPATTYDRVLQKIANINK